MQTITLDFETYFDADYSLRRMTTEAYVRDARFEPHGVALRHGDTPAQWFREPPNLPWSQCAVIAHHAQFDGLILSHHYGIRPALWIDTLSMARVVLPTGQPIGLESLATLFDLPAKTVPYETFKGKHWGDHDFPREAVAAGACHDVELTHSIAQAMLCGGHAAVPYPFPASELPVVDLTIRMFTEPTLSGDLPALEQAWLFEESERQKLFASLNVTEKDLRKDAVFAGLLEAVGVTLQSKTTAKGNEKFPFAKSDVFMQELLESDNGAVSLLAEARLRAHSSIYQTRTERIARTAQRGLLPVYLSYCAAHTRRWGGGDKMNWQNFPRPDPYRSQKGALRRAIKI